MKRREVPCIGAYQYAGVFSCEKQLAFIVTSIHSRIQRSSHIERATSHSCREPMLGRIFVEVEFHDPQMCWSGTKWHL